MSLPVALLVYLLSVPASQGAESSSDWTAWRPVDGNNTIPAGDYPVKWSAEEHVAWKIDLPEAGNSTPIVKGDKIFVTQAITEGKQRGIMCFSAKDGKLLWKDFVQQEIEYRQHSGGCGRSFLPYEWQLHQLPRIENG